MKIKTIAVDFDGVVHQYDKGWGDGTIGEPMPGAFEAIEQLQKAGYLVVIYSCRDAKQIRTWLDTKQERRWASVARKIQVSSGTKPHAIAYIDDRAVRFTNWQDIKKLFI